MKIKEFIKKNKFYIVFFLGFFLLSLFFPYSGDDYVWGTYKLNFGLFKELHDDLFLNGRYLGNLFAVILTRNKVLRSIIMSIVVTLILKIIDKYTHSNKRLLVILFLLIPIGTFCQVVVWSSGFANYGISSLLFLICLDLVNNPKESLVRYILLFICFVASSLFIENVTICLFGITLFLNILYFIKFKKINKTYLIAFAASAVGSLIMFSHPGYIESFNGVDPYRTVVGNGSIFKTAFNNYFKYIYKYTFFVNYIILTVILALLFCYYLKNIKKYSNKLFLLFGVQYILLFYVIFAQSIEVLSNLNIVNGIVCLLLISLKIFTMHLLFKGTELIKLIYKIVLIAIGLCLPLFAVTPVGSRNFFLTYLLFMIIALLVYNYTLKNNKIINIILDVMLVTLIFSFFHIYTTISRVDKERDKYVLEHSCQIIIDVPRVPYASYVWWIDFEYDLGDYYPNYYKKFHNLPEYIYFKFYDYAKWKEKTKDASSCQ